jgi:Cellulase (glycosyl hydrolase family 5)
MHAVAADISKVRLLILRLVLLGATLALILGAATASARPTAALTSKQAETILTSQVNANLDRFTAWLAAGHAKGFIGEVGWPGNGSAAGDPRWNAVARAWYRRAAAKHLTVTAWATGEIWAKTYKLAIYRATTQFSAVDIANPQAGVVEAQPSPALRGINVDGGAFGEYGAGYDPVAATSPLDNVRVGAYGSVYSYPSAPTFRYLASRGIRFVRLAFRWERVQRTPGGPLDAGELARLHSSVDAAGRAGLKVVLDCHNYGAYYLRDGQTGRRRAIGSAQLPNTDFADLWRRLSSAFEDDPAVLGYGLMNEPTNMGSTRTWESASNAAVAAIRSTGDKHRTFVASYGWGNVAKFKLNHPRGPWISDSARNTWYEAHQYFDSDMSSRYRLSFDAEARLAAQRSATGNG